jgi:hypothetical protein
MSPPAIKELLHNDIANASINECVACKKSEVKNYKGIKKQNYLLFKQQYGSVTVVPLPSTVLS